ncbi:hypothetical protein GCM10011344_39750 [Dokdonia pacifica]|uniref:Imelysin n=1 Tax=Dokdonia pacifica TaxID=1627892 RepID=A0A239A761_9FLAO|nr:hypothetical protein [Dokdonia pacifica]GGG35026.1 hypothetical protein GCM10011344_39750 [Dokdonia pacifica]SNR90723.1 hypothetical protein SAMN06265376_104158 [Dokdonia pacifica]
MIPFIKHTIILSAILITSNIYASTNNDLEEKINIILVEWANEVSEITTYYDDIRSDIYTDISNISISQKKATTINQKINLLLLKEELTEKLKVNNLSEISDVSKIRYLKGLQIIKLLYEKMLSLDHHFASVATFNEINNLSNPNYYPRFVKHKEDIRSNANKKQGFNLTEILGDNIYTSVVHSLVSLFTSNAPKYEKETNIKEIECILDFTLRMHTDLKTIYFETAFLQKSNDNTIDQLEQLFVDFTKPIKYRVPLKECRNTDDWSSIHDHLGTYIDALNEAILDESKRYKAHKMQVNLEFPIDRLLQFITQYNSFIDQGGKFYEKFGIMLNSYENEKQCSTEIPIEYKKLKENIIIAIEKFNTAYKPVEINGSKMKEILYGISEYD